MILELSNDEFEIIKSALGRATYGTTKQRVETLVLANRLSHIVPVATVENAVMGEGFTLEAVCTYDDAVDD
jgi:hypothetical protein